MNAAGSQTPGGSGNGIPPRVNPVSKSGLWERCRERIEEDYPWLVGERTFDGIEALVVVLDVEEDARYIGGETWFLRTPEDYFPVLTIYFTYDDGDGRIVLQAVHGEER